MIVMLNVIEYIPKSIALDIMYEIRRVMLPNGTFLAQTGNWGKSFNVGLFTRDFTHELMYTKNSLRQLMLMSDFEESGVVLHAVSYKTTLRNFPLQIISPLLGFILSFFVLAMRMHICETALLIYCVVTK